MNFHGHTFLEHGQSKFEISTYQRLNVETLRRLDLRDLFLGEFLENGSLSSVVETENEDLRLLGGILAQVTKQVEESHILSVELIII